MNDASPRSTTASPHERQSHICIVGINYAPEPTGNAPYTTGLAEHLAREGNRVTVLTGMPYYPEWRVPEGYRGRLRATEMRNGVCVRRFRTYIPPRQTALRRIAFETGFFANGLLCTPGSRPDVILGIVPSLSGGALAAMLAKRYRLPYGLLFQDLVGMGARESGMPGAGSAVVEVTASIEGWVARNAAAIAIVAEAFRARLVELGVAPARIHRVRNWTHVGEATRSAADVRAELGLPRDAVVCLHAGNMGLKQGLENVVETARLAECADPRLLFVLMGDGNQRELLQERARGLINVRFLPPQPDETFPDILAAADVLLVNQRPSVVDMSLPSKLTSYFASGRPVVAAVALASETRNEIDGAEAGVAVPSGDPRALLAAVQALASDPIRAKRLGENGRRHQRQHLSAESVLPAYRNVLAKIASESRSRSSFPRIAFRAAGDAD